MSCSLRNKNAIKALFSVFSLVTATSVDFLRDKNLTNMFAVSISKYHSVTFSLAGDQVKKN